jgi:hypothetical protein
LKRDRLVERFEDWPLHAMFSGSRTLVDGAGDGVVPVVRSDIAAKGAVERTSLSCCMVSVDRRLLARVTAGAELLCS